MFNLFLQGGEEAEETSEEAAKGNGKCFLGLFFFVFGIQFDQRLALTFQKYRWLTLLIVSHSILWLIHPLPVVTLMSLKYTLIIES